MAPPDNHLQAKIHERAETLRGIAGVKSDHSDTAADDLERVLTDLVDRMLRGSEVVLEPASVPPSRAAYVAGFTLFLATTLRTQLQLSGSDPDNKLGLAITTRLFAAFDPPQRQKLFARGLNAVEQMLQILEKAGRLDQWVTELLSNVEKAISDGPNDDLTGLIRQFSTLPLTIRELTSP